MSVNCISFPVMFPVLWFACGVIARGIRIPRHIRENPSQQSGEFFDFWLCLVGGPVWLIAELFATRGPHFGEWRWKAYDPKENQ